MTYLQEIFEKNGIKLDKNQEKQFKTYFSLLVETNKRMNLTAITEEKDVVVKHFLDSVLPAQYLPQNSKVIDVGSGAGFPAIPLKIVRPDLQICMVDSLNKRIGFLNEIIVALNLKNTEAVHARAEDFCQKHRESFDVAVARAVAETNTLVEYLLPLIKIGGVALIYKSTKLDEELSNAQNAIKILGGRIENVVDFTLEEELERKILIVRKTSSTPAKYPRGQNKPKTNPIK